MMHSEENAKNKHCPYINDKCLGRQCMMFTHGVTEYRSNEPVKLGGAAPLEIHHTIKQESMINSAIYEKVELFYCGLMPKPEYKARCE